MTLIIQKDWPDRTADEELGKKTGKAPVLEQLRRSRWYWPGDI